MQGWGVGVSCRGGGGVCVMQGWDGVGYVGVWCVMQGWGGSCSGGVGYGGVNGENNRCYSYLSLDSE